MPRSDHYPLQVRIPLEMHERLLTQSAAESRSLKTVVIRAISQELDQLESMRKGDPKPRVTKAPDAKLDAKTEAKLKVAMEAKVSRQRIDQIRHSDRHAARRVTQAAIKSGKLPKKPCEVCGASKVEAHHDDYSKPLQVRWLCREHHLDWHFDNK